MKIKLFELITPSFIDSPGIGDPPREAVYDIQTLPAYAISNFEIDIPRNGESEISYNETCIDGKKLTIAGLYGTDFLFWGNRRITLKIYYIGIRNHAYFFPKIESVDRRVRAGQLLEEAYSSFDNGNWLSFALMAGGVFEFLLAMKLNKSCHRLKDIINECEQKSIITFDQAKAIHFAREARNLIHENKSGDSFISRESAMSIRLTLDHLIDSQ